MAVFRASRLALQRLRAWLDGPAKKMSSVEYVLVLSVLVMVVLKFKATVQDSPRFKGPVYTDFPIMYDQ